MENEKVSLLAGIGEADITPPLGSELYGYYPHPKAQSVTDRLIVYALALAYGDVKAIIMSVPVCLISNALSDRARKEIEASTGVNRDNVILCATHTHSGPKTDNLAAHGELDMEYCEGIFMPMLVKAAAGAVSTLAPAEMGAAEGLSYVGANRRHIDERGVVTLRQNPWGVSDKTMTVLSFRNIETKKTIASVVHYGAHNTAAGIVNTVTRDWCGIMCDRLAFQSGAPAMFINGSEGDVAPRISSGGSNGVKPDNMESVKEVGNLAALDAIRIWRTIKEYRVCALDSVTGDVFLKCAMSDIRPSFRQTILKLGHTVFIPFPFEFFSSISLRLREYSGFARTLCLGATNGSNNYLPSKDQIPLGGYEVRMFNSSGERRLTDDTDDIIIQENLRLMSAFER